MTPQQLAALTAADMALAAGNASLAALTEAVRVLRESLDVAAPPAPSPAPEPPAPEPPAPPAEPPAPAPTPAGKYRNGQPMLWTRVDTPQVPSRLPGGLPLSLDRVGPTSKVVSARTGWPWRQQGGDWIDADGTLHGTRPWATLPLNAASGPQARASYRVDVTSAVQHIVATNRWCALYLRSVGAPRVIAGGGSEEAPTLTVAYDDGTSEVMPAHVVAQISGSSAYPNTAAAEAQLPAMIEWRLPGAGMVSAHITLTVTQHWSGRLAVPMLEVYIVDPPVNADPVQHGIAAAQPLDAGLVGHPSIIGVHRITDDTTLADVAETEKLPEHLRNYNALRAFDPALFNAGPEDKSLLPHRSLGKWIGASPDRWSVVPSSYAGEGFKPLAAGVGALRLIYPREVDRDGATVGYSTSRDVSAKLFMPPEHFGKLREIHVRYYIRLGTPDGGPYLHDPSTRYQVHKQAGDAPVWTDCAGKIGLMPAHDTTTGGVSGTSGGGRGWQMRMAWSDVDLPAGPDVGGIGAGIHWHDFQNNVPGHNYQGGQNMAPGDDSLAQRGALGGMFYAHQWYCIETRLRLNSIDRPATLPDGTPHLVAGVQQFWAPDGELDVWIDGRLAYRKGGLVMRSLPLQRDMARDRNVYLPPAAELGIRDLWFNWFHGGLTKSSRTRVLFIAGVAWGTDYIGPMRAA